MMEYLRTHEMDVQNAKAALIAIDFVFRAYVDSEKIHGVHFTPGFSYIEHSTNYYQIMPDENIIAVARKVLNDYLSDESSLTKMIAEHKRIAGEIDRLWQENQPLTKLSNQEIMARYDELVSLGRQWWLYGVIGEDKGRIIDEDIVPVFMKSHGLSKSQATHVISTLSHPEEQSAFSQERKDFFAIVLIVLRQPTLKQAMQSLNYNELKQDTDLFEAVKSYIEKYFYQNTDFSDRKVLTFESVIEDIKKVISESTVDSVQKNIDEINGVVQRIHGDKVKIGDMQLTEEEQKLLRYTALAISWLDRRKVDMMKQFFYLFCVVHEMADRINLAYDKAAILAVDEFRAAFLGKRIVDEKEFEKRSEQFMTLHVTDEPLRLFYGDTAKKMFELVQKQGMNEKTIKGSVASRGTSGEKIVSGKVRIVIDPLKDEFNDGEILVTSMTRIEFVPLMKKAKAIVTNEGGIACHAAIVSRELGVPCIIGTRRATRVLKNGDRVELDMESGEIRII